MTMTPNQIKARKVSGEKVFAKMIEAATLSVEQQKKVQLLYNK